jgi:hypothetical protein
MQILPPTELRILSFFVVMAVVFITLSLIESSKNRAAGLIILASFVGIAGSGLIFARYELALELHLLSCLVAAKWLENRKEGFVGDITFLIFLSFCVSLSVWSHIQGLLLLPLTSYFIVRISYRYLYKFALLTMIFPFGFLIPAALKTHHATCTEYPAIKDFFQSMTLSISDITSLRVFSLMPAAYNNFLDSFLYTNPFPMEFLPKIDVDTHLIGSANYFVITSVCLTFILGVSIPFLLLIQYNTSKFFCVLSRLPSIKIIPFDFIVISLLLVFPMLFIFIYDIVHAFYRNFFINHCLSIAVAMIFSLYRGRIASVIVYISGFCITLTACFSLFINSTIILPKLWDGYEGPSLSVFRNWSNVEEDTKNLAGQCKMDFSRGRVVVDDLTQYAMRSSQIIFPVTYVILQSNLIGIPPNEALHRLRANYVVARCIGFNALSLEPEGRTEEICCYNLSGN